MSLIQKYSRMCFHERISLWKVMNYIVSISFGKDSLAMLLKLMELNYKIDEVVFYDTGMEFKAIYNIRNIVKELLDKKNIKYTELKPKVPFINKMIAIEVNKRDKTKQCGYGLCGGMCRWRNSRKKCNYKQISKNKIWS